jgi:hypothetical protein
MFPAIPAQAQLTPNVPADQPARAITTDQAPRFDAAIAPYTEQARKTYPYAKARYLAGLPSGQTFFVTTRLTDRQGHFEGVFIRVTKIADGKITGRIASEKLAVMGYQAGDDYTFPEVELVDWTISKPDGSEEGNVVGKFLDTYRP